MQVRFSRHTRDFSELCVLLGAMALCACGGGGGSSTATSPTSGNPDSANSRPNILLIIGDDVGIDASSLTPGYAGTTGAVATPNLERLAASGLVFDTTWANPMCSPTRSTIVSGLYGHRTGATYIGDVLPTSTTSIFRYVATSSPARYDMAAFGKWHLGGNVGSIQHVRDTGVPVFRGFLGAAVNSYYYWTSLALDGSSQTSTTYSTTALTDYAIDFLRTHRNTRSSDPWFLYLAYNAAHAPNEVPPRALHSMPLGPLTPGTVSYTVPVFKAMIQAMDTELGRLLAEVDLANTVVIFIGDNGTPSMVQDTGIGVRGAKISIYEGGVHVPLVISGAGVTRRGHERALVSSADLYATIAALAGIPVQQINNSHSLVPLLSDATATTGRTHVFTELCGGGFAEYAIRDTRYKLLYDNGSWGLYDLVGDPLEARNLYNDPAAAAARTSLEAQIATLKAGATAGCFR
jgi:arylsulfatase A-like enzyme